jgi:hypothetical protein
VASTERPELRLTRGDLGQTDGSPGGLVFWRIQRRAVTHPENDMVLTDAEMNELLLQHALASKHQGRYYAKRRGARA